MKGGILGQLITTWIGWIAATPVYYVVRQLLGDDVSVWWACGCGGVAWLIVTVLLDIRFRFRHYEQMVNDEIHDLRQ